MASLARGIGATLGEGEFSGGGAGALSGSPEAEGPSLRSQFSMYLPGGFGGGGSGGLRVDDDNLGSMGVCTILGSGSDGSYQIMQGLEARVETPLSFHRSAAARGGARRPTENFSTPKKSEDDDGFFVKQAGGRDGSRSATKRVSAHVLYGPHESGTGICGGIVACGAQRFCLTLLQKLPVQTTAGGILREGKREPRVL